MKQLLVIIGLALSINALAIQPLSELPPLPAAQKLIMSCETLALDKDNTEGYYTPEFVSFKVVQFGFYNATIIGTDAAGIEYLLSENVDEQIREFEPMRGFFQFEEMMNGESRYISLWNDSDQPETEMLVHKTSKSFFTGKILVLWDYNQEYTVSCR